MRGSMDEVEKHCQVLGIDEACSQVELEEAYRERAQAWNPENFAGNASLQQKAREKLGHINAAHVFLRAKLFEPAGPVKPEVVEPTAAPAPAPEWKPELITPAPRNRTAFWITVTVLLFFVACAAALLIWGTEW